jgi:hypothetical protein
MEIRRIHQSEGGTVGDLWDRMCREVEDGGPLTERGRRNLSRMLAMSAWHRDAFCLVAGDGVQVIGFVNGRTGIGDGARKVSAYSALTFAYRYSAVPPGSFQQVSAARRSSRSLSLNASSPRRHGAPNRAAAGRALTTGVDDQGRTFGCCRCLLVIRGRCGPSTLIRGDSSAAVSGEVSIRRFP